MTKKRQPLRAAAAALPSKEIEGTKRRKVEDSGESRSNIKKSSSSSKRKDEHDDDDDNDDDDEEEDDDIALEGQLHFTEPITFEFNDPKEDYAESITVLLKQVGLRFPIPSDLFPESNLASSYCFVANTVCPKSNESLFVSQSDSESRHCRHRGDV
jgi:hypothetical protein